MWAGSEVPGVTNELAGGRLGSRAEFGPTPCWMVEVDVDVLVAGSIPVVCEPGCMAVEGVCRDS